MNNFNLDQNPSTSERVLLALKEARTKLEQVEQEKKERVAIIGMSGRFPGAATVEEFWQNLRNGVNAIQILPPEKTTVDVPNRHYVNAYSSLDDIAGFDAPFFGYSPREAELLDPQHRVFLEAAWSALENAGYDPDRYAGEIGVYAGAALNSYLINLHANPHLRQSVDRVQAVVSNVMGLMPTRVSYKLNLRGPSCGIQTGCSTSLVAVHLAAQSLLHRECDLALAGGVAIDASGQKGYFYQDDGVMSPDGYCRAFDAAAKGTVFGNGVGIVVLKRLSEAIADRDYIYAVIKGSAINNDGAQKVGLTAPSVAGQAAVIAAALSKAEVEPETIQYIETHGTGTALGDPIEIAALTKVFQQHTLAQQFCAIGSVKTNIGHLDAAAGVTGLIKTALALKHQQIPPSLNFQTPNPQIDFAHSPFYVNTQLTPWQNPIRRAAVSSFGMGGTNSHLILESVAESSPAASRPWQLLLLSAKTPTALEAAAKQLADHLQRHADLDLADVAYTLQVGRNQLDHRQIFVCQSADAAVQALSSTAFQNYISNISDPTQPTVTFLFPGQGSQYINMGRELYDCEPRFQAEVDHCCDLLKPHLNLDLRDILYGSSPSSLTQTALAQPALFTIEYALAQLWISWGIQPAAMIGHSIGEYVAACLAGVFSLEDALMLVAVRGRLMQSCEVGAMLSVRLSEAEVSAFLTPDLTLAAVNAPQLCVLSGGDAAIAALEQALAQKDITCRRLQTSHAFHSPSMQPAVEALVRQVQQVQLAPPRLPLISNLTGTWMTAAEATDPNYWGQQLRQTVQFAAGLETLLQKPSPILLEVGAGRTLSTFAKQISSAPTFASLRHPQEQTSDIAFLLNTLGQLWLSGIEINWAEFYAAEQRQRVPLPTYPFEHQRYWVDAQAQLEIPADSLSKQSDLSNWFHSPSWKRQPLAAGNPAVGHLAEQCWLIFSDDSGIGEALIQRLRLLNQTVISIHIGDQFSQNDSQNNNRYVINPACSEDYAKLIHLLQERNQLPQRIVYLWSAELSQDGGFYSLIAVARALKDAEPVQMTVVTQSLHDITGAEDLQPAQALVLGACRVIPQEYSHLSCTCVDLEIPGQVSDSFTVPKRCIDQLVQELMASEFAPPEAKLTIAYRDRHRWVQTYEPMSLAASSSSLLRQGGLYLIAGDLVEGLGLILAQHLAETQQARLILVGRAGLPERADWEQWLATHAPQDPMSRCLKKIQAMEAGGAELRFFSADLADRAALEAIVQTCEPLGQIHGLFHADSMGDRASCLIQTLDQAEIERQFRVKVQGLMTLDAVLQGKVSDFYLLQSSLSAVVGGVGFAAYAAANCFMDAYAQRSDIQRSEIWISVNWDACQLNEPASSLATGQALIDLAITPSEVWEVVQRVLARPDLALGVTQGITQVIVSPADLVARMKQSMQQSMSVAQYARPTISTEFVAPRNEIEQTVAAAMAELLGIERIGIYDNFFELGGHSLLAIQAVSRLRETFQVELPMRDFLFESPTAAGIAQIIAQNQTQEANQNDNQQTVAELLEQIEQMEIEPINIQEQTHGL